MKHILAKIALVVLLAVSAAAQDTAPTPQEIIQRMNARLGANDNEAAIALADELLALPEFNLAVYRSAITAKTRVLARLGRMDEALALIETALNAEGMNPQMRSELLLHATRLYRPDYGLPQTKDAETISKRYADMGQMAKRALTVENLPPQNRVRILQRLVNEAVLTGGNISDDDVSLARELVKVLTDGADTLTPEQRWELGPIQKRIALVWAGRGAPSSWVVERWKEYRDVLRELIAVAPNIEEKVRLQLEYGDVVVQYFSAEEEKARAAWQEVAAAGDAHPYYRYLALDKIARNILYKSPRPAHLSATFPERLAVTQELVNPDKLQEAVGLLQQVMPLELASWVKLNAMVSIARAYESCGKPSEGLAFLKQHALSLPDSTSREQAEIKFIMAELALKAGDSKQARELSKEVLAVPHIRPQLVRAAQQMEK